MAPARAVSAANAYAAFPAASACTSEARSALPPIAQSPPSNSLMRTHVTGRMFSPSTATIASVTLLMSSLYCAGVKTSLITSIVTRGIRISFMLGVRLKAIAAIGELSLSSLNS